MLVGVCGASGCFCFFVFFFERGGGGEVRNSILYSKKARPQNLSTKEIKACGKCATRNEGLAPTLNALCAPSAYAFCSSFSDHQLYDVIDKTIKQVHFFSFGFEAVVEVGRSSRRGDRTHRHVTDTAHTVEPFLA